MERNTRVNDKMIYDQHQLNRFMNTTKKNRILCCFCGLSTQTFLLFSFCMSLFFNTCISISIISSVAHFPYLVVGNETVFHGVSSSPTGPSGGRAYTVVIRISKSERSTVCCHPDVDLVSRSAQRHVVFSYPILRKIKGWGYFFSFKDSLISCVVCCT